MADGKEGDRVSATSGGQSGHESNNPSPILYIESHLVADHLSGVHCVFLARNQCEVHQARYHRIHALAVPFHPSCIRADSHPSGGWYICFPRDAKGLGLVNARRCASHFNNRSLYGSKIKVEYDHRLGERAKLDSPSNPIGASTISRDVPSEPLNTTPTEAETEAEAEAEDSVEDSAEEWVGHQLLRELEQSIFTSKISTTISHSHTSLVLNTDARTTDTHASTHSPSNTSSTTSTNQDAKDSANTVARDVRMSQQTAESGDRANDTGAADVKTSQQTMVHQPQRGERARNADIEEAQRAQWALVPRNLADIPRTNKRRLSIDESADRGKKRKLLNAANGETRSLAVFPDFSVIKRIAGSVAAAPAIILRPILQPMSRLGGAVKEMFLFMNCKVSILAPLVLSTSDRLVQNDMGLFLPQEPDQNPELIESEIIDPFLEFPYASYIFLAAKYFAVRGDCLSQIAEICTRQDLPEPYEVRADKSGYYLVYEVTGDPFKDRDNKTLFKRLVATGTKLPVCFNGAVTIFNFKLVPRGCSPAELEYWRSWPYQRWSRPPFKGRSFTLVSSKRIMVDQVTPTKRPISPQGPKHPVKKIGYRQDEDIPIEIISTPILPLVNGTPYLFIRRHRGTSTRGIFMQLASYWYKGRQSDHFRWVKANEVGIYIAFQDSIDGARDARNFQYSLGVHAERHRRWDPVVFPDSVHLLGEVDISDARRAPEDVFFA